MMVEVIWNTVFLSILGERELFYYLSYLKYFVFKTYVIDFNKV